MFAVILAPLVMFWGGCASSKPANFYVLHSIQTAPPEVQTLSSEPEIAIGVGPVRIPEYLDRPQMAVRATSSGLQFAEFDKWAESLEKNMTRVLADNISMLVPSEHVCIYPWQKCMMVRYQVTVDIVHFEKMPNGKILLDARWNILGDDGEKLLVMRRTKLTLPIESESYEAIAVAQSRAVEGLSREIALAIRSLPSKAN